MIEIVFSDSACGSLKLAHTFGKGDYRSGAVSVFYLGENSKERPTKEEIEQAQRDAEAQQRRAWEQAIAMDGSASDVYGFHLALSVGSISEDTIGTQRQDVLRQLLSVYPRSIAEDAAQTLLDGAKRTLEEVLARLPALEPVRIWYSDQPDELCGMHWFMAQLLRAKHHGAVYLVKLPEWSSTKQGDIVRFDSWGDVSPGEWANYAPLQQEVSPALMRGYAAHWNTLQQENAPLRAALNGRLVSMREDLYDGFILREIEAQPNVFSEASVIGTVLGKYQLGTGDAWIALRIEQMIQAGTLSAVTQPPEDAPRYHRMLKKCFDQSVASRLKHDTDKTE